MEPKRGLHFGFGPLKAVRGARAAELEETTTDTLLKAGRQQAGNSLGPAGTI